MTKTEGIDLCNSRKIQSSICYKQESVPVVRRQKIRTNLKSAGLVTEQGMLMFPRVVPRI